MTAGIIGLMLGMTLGFGSGTGGGAMLGAALGLMAGLGIHAMAWLWAHSGNAPTVEQHRLFCSSYGTAADAELAGDLERGRWLDVKRCSLQGAEVTCDKQCLRLVNDIGMRPGAACGCHPTTTPLAQLKTRPPQHAAR